MPAAVKKRKGVPFPPGLDFFRSFDLLGWKPPNIIDFCIKPEFLNRPNLYPRQATLLKVMFLQTELLTAYDYSVIGGWTQNYLDTADEHGEGNNGMVPDVLERMRINRMCPCGHDRGEHLYEKAGQVVWDGPCQTPGCCEGYRGRRWFRQTSNISGRRGSKGHIGAQAGAYVLWNYMGLSDPQSYFGVDRDKPLTGIVFAGKKDQALKNQWGDLNNVILGGPCFSPYISKPMGESLSVYSPWDWRRKQERQARGIEAAGDMATFQIVPKESTLMAGRGPASFMQFYDEMAHVVATGANRSAEEVFGSATPSLDQFKEWAFIYIPTSPWQKIGQSYIEYQQSIEVNEDGSPAYPEKLMVQLTSWDIYKDWEIAHTIQSTPDGLFFPRLKGAIQAYDDDMKQLEKANPETFAVERRSRWATAMNAYLNADRVKEMWQPWPDVSHPMKQETRGILSKTYRAHGDPSKSGAGFGFAVAHIEGVDDRGLPHVVFDQIRSWNPADFPDHQIDYDVVERDLEVVVHDFMPSELTFDQFNSVGTIQRLQKFALRSQFPKRVQVYERTATGPLNWKTYETFKTALNMGLVHGPYMELADLELTFLQDLGGKVEHPTTGPVQTKDVADCYDGLMEVLTEQGWMLIKDVPRGIKVATRSPEGVLEYQEPTDYIARHHKGVMYEYDEQNLNFSVTPGHRMLVADQYGKERFVTAENLTAQRYFIPKTAVVEDRAPNVITFDVEDLTAATRRVIGRGGARNESGWTEEQDEYLRQHYATASMADLCAVLGKTRAAIYNRAKPKHLDLKRGQVGDRIGDRPAPLPETKVEDFAAFLGIWLAEGRKMRDKPGYDVKITQTKPDAVEWIDNLFARLPWPVKRSVQANGETVWVVKSHGLREYLRACQGEGHELLIPDEVFTTWTRREMEQLLEGLLVGDGCWSKQARRHVGYYSTSKRLVDDVQRLLAHLGLTGRAKVVQRVSQYRANHDLWYVGVSVRPRSLLETARLKQVPYDDMVYCLTVPNSTLLVRRNGVPMWAGNCIAIVVYELIGNQMSAFIGKSLSDLTLGVAAPGGFDPYQSYREPEMAHSELSGFSAARRGYPGGGRGSPARGGASFRGRRS